MSGKIRFSLSEFDEYYKKHFQREFLVLDPIRKKYLFKFYCYLFGFVLFWGVLSFIFISFSEGHFQDVLAKLGVYILILLGLSVNLLALPFKQYKKNAKRHIIPEIMAFFKNISYVPDKDIIELDVLKNSNLFMGVDYSECDDAFIADCQGVKVKIAEMRLAREKQTIEQKQKVSLFDGVIVLLDCGKKFNERILCESKKNYEIYKTLLAIFFMTAFCLGLPVLIHKEQLPWIAILFYNFPLLSLLIIQIFKRYRRVFLEDVEFNKYWNVIASDQVETRYVLTPALMERMLKIEKIFHGNGISFAFFDDKVLIAINTQKDMFEASSLFSPYLSYDKVKEVILQFYDIFAVVDLIRLQNYGVYKYLKKGNIDDFQTEQNEEKFFSYRK